MGDNSRRPDAAIPHPDYPTGMALLHAPELNKGTAFTATERARYGLEGLLPPHVSNQDEQVRRILENFRRKPDHLEQYILMIGLLDRNEQLFYRVVMDHLGEMMPVIYTPTVGLACQRYGHIFQRARGMFVSIRDRGHVDRLLANWPHDDVRVICVTDGSRILGLGDLGACGMGIPVGKLSLYTACAGVDPGVCLPVVLDAGTDNETLLDDPLYIGLNQRRLRGPDYDDFVYEFLLAVHRRFPKALVQLEDFSNASAFRLLGRYRNSLPLFDDDIQGTGAAALAGLWSAARIAGRPLADQRVLFLGAGEAGIGIADAVTAALTAEGMDEGEARRHSWLFDSRGLVVEGRDRLNEKKRRYAHAATGTDSFLDAIRVLEPTAIIGVAGHGGLFDQPVIEAMSELNRRPIVFALSNPTSRSECTASQAYEWSQGRAIFASGSPFGPVHQGTHTFVPGQGNNAMIFPGVGLGLVVSEARHVSDEVFGVAASALAEQVTDAELAAGSVFPAIDRIRDVSLNIAVAVADQVRSEGQAGRSVDGPWDPVIREHIYDPRY